MVYFISSMLFALVSTLGFCVFQTHRLKRRLVGDNESNNIRNIQRRALEEIIKKNQQSYLDIHTLVENTNQVSGKILVDLRNRKQVFLPIMCIFTMCFGFFLLISPVFEEKFSLFGAAFENYFLSLSVVFILILGIIAYFLYFEYFLWKDLHELARRFGDEDTNNSFTVVIKSKPNHTDRDQAKLPHNEPE